jgi:hypothetical protein
VKVQDATASRGLHQYRFSTVYEDTPQSQERTGLLSHHLPCSIVRISYICYRSVMAKRNVLRAKRKLLSILCEADKFDEKPAPMSFQNKVAKEVFEQYNTFKSRQYKAGASKLSKQPDHKTPKTEKRKGDARDEKAQNSNEPPVGKPFQLCEEEAKEIRVGKTVKEDDDTVDGFLQPPQKIIRLRRLKKFYEEDA